jgi:hypothetical protein
MASLALAAAAIGGCGTSDTGASQFVATPDGAVPDSNPTLVPTLEAGVAGLAGCASATDQAMKIPVYMLIVLDGSGSMVDAHKWEAVVPALDSIFDDLEKRADPAFGVGLTVFADQNDPTITDFTAGPYDRMDVPVAFVDAAQHQALHARIDLTSPNLGTPTFEVLTGQFPLLEAFQPAAPLLPGGKKVLVFMTDGVPDPDMPAGINEGPYSLKLAQDESTKAPPGGPVTTFAVGVGPLPGSPTDYDPRWMGAMAIAGGSPNQPCDPNETLNPMNMCHFQITPGSQTAAQLTQEFIDTLNKIRQKVLSCEFVLDKNIPGGGMLDPSKVNVVYTSGAGVQTLLPEDGANGWTYDDPTDPTEVILHGATCDTVKADVDGKIDIVLGCVTITK